MPKKIPLRQCVGCREMKPKRELVRVAHSPEGKVSLDRSGKAPGRGAYICPKEECLRKAQKSGALSHAFGVPVGPEVYEALAREVRDE